MLLPLLTRLLDSILVLDNRLPLDRLLERDHIHLVSCRID
jgi:hypothetical protein